MTNGKSETLPEILAGLKALAAELRNDSNLGDDGIPVLTMAVATPTPAGKGTRAIGAPIPTLSTVVARPEKDKPVEASKKSYEQALDARITAGVVIRRVDKIWRETGNSPLEPAMITALERALAEALHNPT
ncbi:MAG: hypothetical protein ACYDEV_02470 [Acidiferrobacter sp.]